MRISKRAFASWQSAILAVAFAATATYGADMDAYWDNAMGLPGADGYVTIMMAVDSAAYVGGYFTNIGGIKSQGIAKWDGNQWQSMSGGVQGGLLACVQALAVVGTSVYVGGSFTETGGVLAPNLARWDGHEWHDVGGGVEHTVWNLAVIGTDLFVGGSFNRAGEIAATNLARWDGANWHALEGDFPGEGPGAMAVHGGMLYAFWSVRNPQSGQDEPFLSKWDGTNWIRAGLTGTAADIYSARSGLWAGGDFGGTWPWKSVAFWNGTTWSYRDAGLTTLNEAYAFAEAQGSTYLAAGSLEQGIPLTAIMAWVGERWVSTGTVAGSPSLGAQVTSLASNETELFVGGVFDSVGGKPATNLAVWHVPRALKAVRQGDQCVLSWPAPDTDMALETADSPNAAQWQAVDTTPVVVGHRLTITNTVSSAARFYRLRQR